MEIKNSMRKNQIKEFVDDDHKVMSSYYDLIDSDISEKELEKGMRMLIGKDEYFFDPYIVLASLLSQTDRADEAEKLLKTAYTKAAMKIADKDGNWPKEMAWGFMENRHLMRVIAEYGRLCWQKGEVEQALYIFRKLLRSNPGDNQGIRDYILAILLGLDEENWYKSFELENGALDAGKLYDWFEKNAKKFPDEFDWWFKKMEEEGMY